MKPKFLKIFAYVIPTILVFIIISLYLEIDTGGNSEHNSLQKNILENVLLEMDIALQKENYKYKIFKNSFINSTPFSSVAKSKQISYVQLLKNKCLNSNSSLSEDEKVILQSYSNLLHITNGIYYNNEVLLLKILGFVVSILILITIYVLLKKLRNRFYRKIGRYYIVLFFLINYSFSSSNSSDLLFLKEGLEDCHKSTLSLSEKKQKKKRIHHTDGLNLTGSDEFFKDLGKLNFNMSDSEKKELDSLFEEEWSKRQEEKQIDKLNEKTKKSGYWNRILSNPSNEALNKKADLEKEVRNLNKKRKINNTNDNWKRIFVKNMGSIDLPPTLEIQKGTYKKLADKLKNVIGFEVDDLVAQNIGVNEFRKEGKQKYARVMLLTDIGNKGNFEDLNFSIDQYSKDEVIEIGNNYKNLILQQFSKANQISNSKLIKWYPPVLDEINQMSFLRLKYERQLDSNPIVLVNTYIFYNNDKVHTLTMSYRKKESSYWKNDFQKILKSLEISKSE